MSQSELRLSYAWKNYLKPVIQPLQEAYGFVMMAPSTCEDFVKVCSKLSDGILNLERRMVFPILVSIGDGDLSSHSDG